jgi:hypothetical protein
MAPQRELAQRPIVVAEVRKVPRNEKQLHEVDIGTRAPTKP